MAYNRLTDFLALWRNAGPNTSKLEIPGLDLVVQVLANAGLITLSVGAAPPGVNQATTAWLQAAVPSYSVEGVLRLWNPTTAAYVAATPALFFKMLQTAAGQNGVSWYATTLGPPANIIGLDGDYAIRTDEPGGIYGPKLAGAWPANPVPGSTDLISSLQLDNTFGAAQGNMLYRGAGAWQALPVGAINQILASTGAIPAWVGLSALMDALFGGAQGAFLYRGAAGWASLAPGTPTNILVTNGPGADPTWGPRTAEFPSGTTMLFQQSAAPPGWTKSLAYNDYGLRVTSGAAGSVPGSAFSAVFAQTVVGDHTLSIPEMPAHGHNYNQANTAQQFVLGVGNNAFIANVTNATVNTGGGAVHSHAVNLTLSYVDVIIATKN